ncbi:hypothetical protein CVT24_007648 [Panaeolus cyanescens]|uniref:Chromo domain-containing protein n=1 Tax=Panaeolus cyanescens TaxID=181874 RepID=A0A409W4U2_9AGAR|nr:hypothetical protein CVT24_007648 [Panaeolus cyanescens]
MPPSAQYSPSTQTYDLVIDDHDLLVEKIIDQSVQNGQLKYLVKWQGLETPTWEESAMWEPYTTDLGFWSAQRSENYQNVRHEEHRRDATLDSSATPARSSMKGATHKSLKRKRTVRFESPLPGAHERERQPERPPPFFVDGTLHYEVEKVLQSRLQDGVVQYLIKWLGYDGENECTWEPADNVFAQEELAEFYRAHPDAV